MKKDNNIQTLEQQLADSEKKSQALRDKIEQHNNNSNNPKDITDKVKTLADVFKIAKPTKEEWAILRYEGKSNRMLFAKYMMILSLISEVLNEGHVFTMKPDEKRHYPYFYLAVSSGFAFNITTYIVTGANTSSASRLCLKNEKLAKHAGQIFLKDYKNAITL